MRWYDGSEDMTVSDALTYGLGGILLGAMLVFSALGFAGWVQDQDWDHIQKTTASHAAAVARASALPSLLTSYLCTTDQTPARPSPTVWASKAPDRRPGIPALPPDRRRASRRAAPGWKPSLTDPRLWLLPLWLASLMLGAYRALLLEPGDWAQRATVVDPLPMPLPTPPTPPQQPQPAEPPPEDDAAARLLARLRDHLELLPRRRHHIDVLLPRGVRHEFNRALFFGICRDDPGRLASVGIVVDGDAYLWLKEVQS